MRSDHHIRPAHPRRHALRVVVATIGAFLAIAPVARAQQPAARPPALNTVTVNPLYLPFGLIVAEYERAIAPGATLGVSAGYYEPIGQGEGDHDRYGSGEAKLRFYPGERAPRGLSIGVTAGFATFTTDGDCCTDEGNAFRGAETKPTFGVVLDHNWLLGRSRRFVVGTGIGAKRLLGQSRDSDFFDDLRVIPMVRLQVGAAF
jgi:hypothetical protein